MYKICIANRVHIFQNIVFFDEFKGLKRGSRYSSGKGNGQYFTNTYVVTIDAITHTVILSLLPQYKQWMKPIINSTFYDHLLY
jgi:hypothetical protein